MQTSTRWDASKRYASMRRGWAQLVTGRGGNRINWQGKLMRSTNGSRYSVLCAVDVPAPHMMLSSVCSWSALEIAEKRYCAAATRSDCLENRAPVEILRFFVHKLLRVSNCLLSQALSLSVTRRVPLHTANYIITLNARTCVVTGQHNTTIAKALGENPGITNELRIRGL
jgi:hypothetical protein